MKTETLKECNICHSKKLEWIDKNCHICQCHSCGFIFDNPRPTVEEIIKFYSTPQKYDIWLADESARDSMWKRRLKKLIKTRKYGNLLDVGTGIGQFLFHASSCYTEVCGTEVSNSAIDIARIKYKLDITHGELESIDFNNKRFDNITMFHVLEHVPDPSNIISICRTLLTNEGVLVIAVPNDVRALKTKLKLLLKKIGVNKFQNLGKIGLPKIKLDGTIDEIHLSHFTPEVIKYLLTAHGFQIVEESLDPYYSVKGIKKVIFHAYYFASSVINKLFKINFYDTIWVVARKA